jgi:hypothetical protein
VYVVVRKPYSTVSTTVATFFNNLINILLGGFLIGYDATYSLNTRYMMVKCMMGVTLVNILFLFGMVCYLSFSCVYYNLKNPEPFTLMNVDKLFEEEE